MPAPPRPSGPISPADLLWRHELREQNAMLLRRMNALEAKFEDQERRAKRAEEAAAICTGMSEQLENVKSGIDQLETKQQEFVSTIHKQLVDMHKDMDDFRKTQERVQKLMKSCRELDDSVGDLSSLGPRVEDVEREVQGVKNTVGRRHVQEMENLDARIEALELQRSRARSLQDDFSKKCDDQIQALQAEVAKLKEIKRTVPGSPPSIQVSRSPEVGPSFPTIIAVASEQPTRKSALKKKGRQQPQQEKQRLHQEIETQGTTQNSTQLEEADEIDLDTPFVARISPSNREDSQSGMSPRKKPKLSHPKPQPQPQSHKTHPSTVFNPAPIPPPSKIVRLQFNKNKKRPGSPISAPRPTNKLPSSFAPRQPVSRGPAIPSKSREKKAQPIQSTRRSRRRSAQASLQELGLDGTQRPQNKAGPVYGSALADKTLKTKPRRMPPVPGE